MNGKIDGLSPNSARPPTASSNGLAKSADRQTPAAPAPVPDSVQLSGDAAGLVSIQKALATAPSTDLARVAAVRAQLDNGTYRIDPQAIAARLAQLERELGG